MKDKVRILQGTISGLYYLHTLNPPFVHCNLTTENILLHEGLRAKIGGFSIANTNFAHNREYMPPEAQEDVQPLHPSYDIFSLGEFNACGYESTRKTPTLVNVISKKSHKNVRKEQISH